MIKKICRVSALTLAAAVVMGQMAYADVYTAPSPNGTTNVTNSTAGNVNSQAAISSSNFVQNPDGTYQGIISQTGPTGQKQLTNGVLVIGSGNDAANGGWNSVAGPGAGNNAAASTAANTTSTAASTAAAVNINSEIAKPSVSAEAAVLYDATTNQFLFDKNGTVSKFPASTTKLMTALLVSEKLSLSDTLTFSSSAVDNLESGAVTAGMKTGDTMTVQDAMYAMMLKSACEVANGLAEKVSGSQAAFAQLMTQRAKELGCTGTNFTNASGLNSTNHYTTAHDMALIAAAALSNSTVRTIAGTRSYTLPATGNRGSLALTNGNKMLAGGTESYEGYVAGKTGYTSKAGNCLAGVAEYNGHQLIAVVFKANQTHYADSKAMFDYGKKLIGGNTAVAATTTATATAAASTTGTTNSTSGGKWIESASNVWKYQKANGSYCSNEWLDVNGKTYFFGSDGVMCTGWKQFTNGNWYYFNPENGAMVCGKWVTQNNKSYYLQANGVMAVNTTIDGKYKVNENGVYVEKVG